MCILEYEIVRGERFHYFMAAGVHVHVNFILLCLAIFTETKTQVSSDHCHIIKKVLDRVGLLGLLSHGNYLEEYSLIDGAHYLWSAPYSFQYILATGFENVFVDEFAFGNFLLVFELINHDLVTADKTG